MKTYEQLYDETGDYKLDKNYTEILKLDKLLNDANIPHTLKRFYDGWQVVYSVNGKRISDAVQHYFSYGHSENLIEIMGLVTLEETSVSVLGHLTADDVFNRISEHYNSHPTEKGEQK